jgi:hypothetical protein
MCSMIDKMRDSGMMDPPVDTEAQPAWLPSKTWACL